MLLRFGEGAVLPARADLTLAARCAVKVQYTIIALKKAGATKTIGGAFDWDGR